MILRIITTTLFLVLGAGALSGQDSDALEEWQKAQILDKGRIAEKTYEQLYGLEAAGNPHWTRNTVLEGARAAPDDPTLNDVRRERALRAFSGRALDWTEASQPATSPRSRRVVQSGPKDEPESTTLRWLSLLLLGGGGAAVFLTRARGPKC